MQGAIEAAERLASERGAFMPQQFDNAATPGAHEGTTAVELLEAMGEDRVDAFLAGHAGWTQEDAVRHAMASGHLTDEGLAVIKAGQGPSGSVRLSPRSAGTDVDT